MLRKNILLENCIISTFFRSALFSAKVGENTSPKSKQSLLKLRNATGYPLISCKEALKATDYDIDQAKEYLQNLAKEKGWNKMKDISPDRLCQGLVGVAKNKTTAAMVEINCATDFVAKTSEFQQLVKGVAEVVIQHFPTDTKISISTQEILEINIPGENQKLSDKIALTIGKVNEQIFLRRACVLAAAPGGSIASYIHPSTIVSATRADSTLGMFAALASISCVNDDRSANYIKLRGRDICQHIVGMSPLTMGEPPSAADRDITTTEKNEIEGSDENNSDFYQDFPPPKQKSLELLSQAFLLDTDLSVEHWLNMNDLKVNDFVRYQVNGPIE